MDPAAYTAIFSAAGITVVNLIGLGISIGVWKTTLRALRDSHSRLKDAFVDHKDDRDIHVDPRRDTAALFVIQTTVSRIDKRCEERGNICAGHFTSVERKIAAQSG